MKTILFLIPFILVKLHANENWIKIEPYSTTKSSKTQSKSDINISQIEPVNKMIKRATAIKQILDATNKKKVVVKEKNWFELN